MIPLNLSVGARPDEQFHLQYGAPRPYVRWSYGVRRVEWANVVLPNGMPGEFTSYWFAGVKWYRGTAKCDGTRTYAYWYGQLGEPVDLDQYVMTTTPKEMFSLRFGWYKADTQWNNMGSI